MEFGALVKPLKASLMNAFISKAAVGKQMVKVDLPIKSHLQN